VKSIYDLTIDELKEYFIKIGQPKYRATQVFEHLHKGTLVHDIPNIPKELREQIAADFCAYFPKIVTTETGSDGTVKHLLELVDGERIECVVLSQDYGKTVCVSTQVGCRMRCAFCASGRDGFVRNLSAGEILSQVILAKPSRVVLMGSGEPLDNFDNVMKFIELTTIGARNISLSTVGLVDKIRQFADLKTGVNLCISLHAPNDNIRQSLIPMAKKWSIKELIESARYFFEKTGRRVIFEYSLINGINCSPENARELSNLVRGFPTHVNLINLNSTGTDFKAPPREVGLKFMDVLIKSGTSCTMRKSRGSDILAACGQLKLHTH